MDKASDNYKISSGREGKRLRQKFVTFFFFLLLSILFWLLSALDHSYSTNITFPIKYVQHLPNKEMVGDIPTEIKINITAQGYSLLGHIFTSKKKPIQLQVINLPFINLTEDSSRCIVLVHTFKESVQRQLGNEVQVNYILPDTLYYSFSPIVRKKVPIKPNLDLEFSKQFMQGGNVIIQPDSIIIAGPSSILDTINKVLTVHYRARDVNKSFSVDLKLKNILNVYFVKNSITITVPVEKYTESSLIVPIRVINVPDSLDLKVFPTHVKVNVIIALQNYNRLSPQNFVMVVDFRTINYGINNKLRVNMLRCPGYVKVIGFSPRNVEYLIEK